LEKLSGGEIIVSALRDAGIRYVWGYPGGAALHIYDALFRQEAVHHLLVRHEQAAIHAADGFSRATGMVGTALVTSGPGATNAITGIATAYMDSIPLVVISGQVPLHKIGQDAFQETDMIGVSRPIVKHSFLVTRTEDIADAIAKAFYIASTGRPGPVVVDIPKDITDPDYKIPYTWPGPINMRSYQPAEKGHRGQIKRAVQKLIEARKPIIYSGGGVIIDNASDDLVNLVRELNYPITSTLMGLGAFPGTDPLFLGMLGMHGTYEANAAMHEADVILAVGARFDDRVTNELDKFCPEAVIVHIDIDPTSVSKNIDAHIPIVGGCSTVLREILSLIRKSNKNEDSDISAWWKKINQWRNKYGIYTAPRHAASSGRLIKPQDVIRALYDITDGDAYVTSDVGQHQMFAAQYYLFDKPRQWINSGGLGTMGFGLPAAMGVQLAFPEADVACVTGEGSIQMCIQELSTCSQHRLPIKIINLNNSALGMVRQWQDMNYSGRYAESLYENSLPDFVALAEAYGHVGMRVQQINELVPMMEKCFSLKDRVVFMDIDVDPEEHVYPMQVPGGAMRDLWLNKNEKS
tara:strand:- start:15544 stop:17277 length:1734 start_codon:yes stop_codon:yes gene_type:complete